MNTPHTAIPAHRLADLRAHAHEESRHNGSFVDPRMIHQCTTVLDRRGEQWAAAVLGRTLTRRSIAIPTRPYLQGSDPYTLVAADHEEDTVACEGMSAE